VDPHDLSAESVAAKIGLPPEQAFKTLAVQGDRNGTCLAVISANQELNFKALANQTEDRKIEMVPMKEVRAFTGYIRGGVDGAVVDATASLGSRRSSSSIPVR
jgi:Cys-tRNA(Pro)/Cys-tRNA(Cys) deacylase